MKDIISLLKAAQRLDEEAIVEIFDKFGPGLYKYARRLGYNEISADQLVADVFARFVEALADGKGPRANLRSYLYKNAYQMMAGRLPESTDQTAAARSDQGPYTFAHANDEERAKAQQLILSMVTELTDDQRHVLILRYLEEFSLKEIAEIMDKDVNNIKIIQYRAIARLEKAMGR